MYDAVLKIDRDDVKDALEKFSEISCVSRRKLFLTVACEKEYDVIKESVYLMQSTILFYLTHALDRQKQRDDLVFLRLLSYAAGINAVLGTTFFSVLRRYAVNYNAKEEVDSLQKLNEYADQQINALTIEAIGRLSGKEQHDAKERLNESVKTMLSLVSNISSEVRDLAVTLGKRFPAGDFKQARRLYEYVRDEIAYVRDPVGIEEIRSPETTLKLGAGDCDDKAVLLVAMLKSIGFEACFFIADVDNDGYADHVYTGVFIPNAPDLYRPLQDKRLPDGRSLHDWIPLDPTYEDSDFGVIPLIDLGILQYIPIVSK